MRRLSVGLNLFFNNSTNSGVVNYVYNIIAALATLPDDRRPALIVFHSADAPVDYIKSIGYPGIRFECVQPQPTNGLLKLMNRVVRKITGVNAYVRIRYVSKVDVIYPYFAFMDKTLTSSKCIHWLVDFNNRAFPQHYKDNGRSMQSYQEYVTSLTEKVVLSSHALLDEMKEYYPGYRCHVRILRFASSIAPISQKHVSEALQKHALNDPYLMSPNQFWEHKNQIVVLKAIEIIRQAHPDRKFQVLFTGSLEVNRGKGQYVDQLREFIDQNDLAPYVRMMGVLDRDEQLALMKGAIALVQPSFYEGWSTLVEEAKALGQFIILSELPVHREQIDTNVDFFDPKDPSALAEKMLNRLTQSAPIVPRDYSINVRQFGIDIMDTFEN